MSWGTVKTVKPSQQTQSFSIGRHAICVKMQAAVKGKTFSATITYLEGGKEVTDEVLLQEDVCGPIGKPNIRITKITIRNPETVVLVQFFCIDQKRPQPSRTYAPAPAARAAPQYQPAPHQPNQYAPAPSQANQYGAAPAHQYGQLKVAPAAAAADNAYDSVDATLVVGGAAAVAGLPGNGQYDAVDAALMGGGGGGNPLQANGGGSNYDEVSKPL